MRYIVFLLALSTGLRADEVSKTAKVEELLRVMKTEVTLEQVYGQMTKQVDLMTKAIVQQGKLPATAEPQLADLEKRMMAIVSDQLSWDKLKPLYIKIYTDTFDEDEIDGLLAFYRSSVGQTFVDKTPVVMQKSNDAMQTRLPEVMGAIQKATRDFVQQQQQQPKP